MQTITDTVLEAVDAYKAYHNVSDTALSLRADTDPRTIGRIRKGKSVGLALIETIYEFVRAAHSAPPDTADGAITRSKSIVQGATHDLTIADPTPDCTVEQSFAIPPASLSPSHRPIPRCPGVTTGQGGA